ncbi:hypothetical protein POM88_002074 [Heracleum sosnowskyi]|uniref:Transcriptional coactivator Hfi1/Transcriptional adapter 1 n=1 Tax=Heracleum sosnowskyi TaxID=360622 RepID=A0AAD8NA86_9APIA|nr:hypothetical protein POM88_002074 [Heracleum sosnowskyi]
MVANQKPTPVGAVELKAVIYRRIGSKRAENYFDLLKRFLSLKVKKCDFDKSCMEIIGRDNLSLHNQLIRTILENASVGEVPLSRAKNTAVVASPNVEVANCLPVNRSLVNQDRKFRDHPGPLDQVWKSQQSGTGQLSIGSRPPIEVASVEDEEEVEQADGSPGIQSRSPVIATLGISIYKGADFGFVMDSNPYILGGDWAVLHEKASVQAFEE